MNVFKSDMHLLFSNSQAADKSVFYQLALLGM